MNEQKTVVVLGGYGAVGTAVCEELLAQASVVVNCVEYNNFEVAEYCLANSTDYIDVSATIDVLTQLQTLESAAKRANKQWFLALVLLWV